jgi:hypothetical protein
MVDEGQSLSASQNAEMLCRFVRINSTTRKWHYCSGSLDFERSLLTRRGIFIYNHTVLFLHLYHGEKTWPNRKIRRKKIRKNPQKA